MNREFLTTRKSKYRANMEWLRGLLVDMQEQDIDDRYGDSVPYDLHKVIKFLTDEIELSKRKQAFRCDIDNQPLRTNKEYEVYKLVNKICDCICAPDESCGINIELIAKEFEKIFSEKNNGEFCREKETIIADNSNINRIVEGEIKKYGNRADLNHIDVSGVTNMSGLFKNSDFNGDISKWNVSGVDNMCEMFHSSKFNGDISGWDVSNVTDMLYMFAYSEFNQDISDWNVSSVINMIGVFQDSVFNQDISRWDVSNVKNMCCMFAGAEFNQDISDWDVSNVNNMGAMFAESYFMQDISRWDVSNVQDMFGIFCNSCFNKDVSSWKLNNNVRLDYIFYNCPVSNFETTADFKNYFICFQK